MRPLAVLVLLASCGGGTDTSSGAEKNAADYLAPEGTFAQLGPSSDPASGPWLMFNYQVLAWELREGKSWNAGKSLGTLPVDASSGISVDGSLLLPDRPSEGASSGDVEVLSIGDEETYYGTFPDAIRVRVGSGRFEGEQVWGVALGLVRATIDGDAWEIVYYE
jgi:hypothetical protein